MAFSKATLIKRVKAVGTYAEAEIAEAIEKIDDSEVATFNQLIQKLHKNLAGVKTEKVDGRKPEKKKAEPTMEQKFTRLIEKIRMCLEKYEASDAIDNWSLAFTVGEYYGNKTFTEIQDIHLKLVNAGATAEKMKLLTFFERGSMYNFLKQSDERFGRWRDVCHKLNVCRSTVDRYVDFYHIISAYPRLLICELIFETIMTFHGKLKKYLERHDDLEGKLRLPLKQIRIGGGGIHSSRRLPGGQGPADDPEELLTDDANWDPSWQLADELFDSSSE